MRRQDGRMARPGMDWIRTACGRLMLGATLFGVPLGAPLGAFAGEIRGQVNTSDGEPLRQAVVFLTAMPAGAAFAPPEEPAIMDQVDLQFMPRVLPIVAGSAVRFPNRDQVHHHVYSFARVRSSEVPLYKEEPAPVRFPDPGVVKIGCNIHDWMSAAIVVVPTPYFALTDETGAFVLHDVPPDSHRVSAWHDRARAALGESVTEVKVGAEPVTASFSLETRPATSLPPRSRESSYR